MDDGYYKEVKAPFEHWWLVDNPAWVVQRNKDWELLENTLFSQSKSEDLENYKKYFFCGHRLAYIPEAILYLLTPFTCSKQARELFYSELFSFTDRQNLMSSFLYSTENVHVLSWYRNIAKWFVEGVLTSDFKVLRDKKEDNRIYSPEPTAWCLTYVVLSNKVLSGKLEYHGIVEASDYFLSALPHACDPDYRPFKKFKQFLTLIGEALENDAISEDARWFAQKLKAKEEQINEAYLLNAQLDG